MIPNIVIHIGGPKTGSTSIQEAMQSDACICPSLTLAYQAERNASELALSLVNGAYRKPRSQELWRARGAWAAQTDADIGIISAEFFERVKPKLLKRVFEENFSEQSKLSKIVGYVRPHAGRYLSGYGQRIKTGAFFGTADEFCDYVIDRPVLKYAKKFKPWRRVFNDRFVLRPFIRSELRQGDVVEDFFNIALSGADHEPISIDAKNEALSVEELSMLRVLQTELRNAGVADHTRMPIGNAIATRLNTFDGRYSTKLSLDRRNAQLLHDVCKQDAQKLDKAFWGAPLMRQELDRAVDTAVQNAPPVDAASYFSLVRRREMQRLANAIASKLLSMPDVWREAYLIGFGQLPDHQLGVLDRIKRGLNRQDEHVSEVWALIDEVAKLLLKSS